jgi:hypothetical protein
MLSSVSGATFGASLRSVLTSCVPERSQNGARGARHDGYHYDAPDSHAVTVSRMSQW